MVWFIVFGAIGAILSLVLHEFSHCVYVWMHNGKVTSFKPWPQVIDGHFYFGRMLYESQIQLDRGMNLAPLIRALICFALWSGLGFLWYPLWCLAFWDATDWVNWLQGYIRKSPNDGGQYRTKA